MTDMHSTTYVHSTTVHNTNAASEIVPTIMELLKPKNVVDVGCGLGTWLSVFRSHGVMDIMGIDGEHLDLNYVKIEKDKILLQDLNLPIKINKRFALAVCLEVAEHLHENSANTLVKSLVDLSDAIFFSAAIPDQGGQNHLNEQWVEYWQEKFALYDYQYYDILRPLFWNNEKVEWWYKQNMFLILKNRKYTFKNENPILNLIHPHLFTGKIKALSQPKK